MQRTHSLIVRGGMTGDAAAVAPMLTNCRKPGGGGSRRLPVERSSQLIRVSVEVAASQQCRRAVPRREVGARSANRRRSQGVGRGGCWRPSGQNPALAAR